MSELTQANFAARMPSIGTAWLLQRTRPPFGEYVTGLCTATKRSLAFSFSLSRAQQVFDGMPKREAFALFVGLSLLMQWHRNNKRRRGPEHDACMACITEIALSSFPSRNLAKPRTKRK